jgi:hypothetical protein
MKSADEPGKPRPLWKCPKWGEQSTMLWLLAITCLSIVKTNSMATFARWLKQACTVGQQKHLL